MRKYTLEHYKKYIKQIDNKRLRNSLEKYKNTVVKEIDKQYKTPGYYIDVLYKFEDFWIVATYDLYPIEICQIEVIRFKSNKKHSQYYAKYSTGWSRGKYGFLYSNLTMKRRYLYANNLKTLFKGTEYEYSQLWILAKHIDLKINYYLLYCSANLVHKIECLTKLKCYKLARDICNGKLGLKYNEENIYKALGLSNYNQLKFVAKNNLDADSFRSYRYLLEYEIPIKYFKMLKGFLRYRGLPNFNFITKKAFIDYYISQKEKKIFNLSFTTFVDCYLDMYRFCNHLKLDMNNTMYSKPNNFMALHDSLSAQYQLSVNKVKEKDFQKVYKKFHIKDEIGTKYAILKPKTSLELITEGKNLNHCVGSYIKRVCSQESIIMFLRDSKDIEKSYFTFEINPKDLKLVQLRGRSNCSASADIKSFVNEYLNKLRLNKVG